VSDFDRIEEVAGTVGSDLTFATVGLSACITLTITLNTVSIVNERLHNEFFIAACISGVVAVVYGFRWLRQGGELSKLMARIRAGSGVGPLGDNTNPIGQDALDHLPLIQAVSQHEAAHAASGLTAAIKSESASMAEAAPVAQVPKTEEPASESK
jgi:hypothetical protein